MIDCPAVVPRWAVVGPACRTAWAAGGFVAPGPYQQTGPRCEKSGQHRNRQMWKNGESPAPSDPAGR